MEKLIFEKSKPNRIGYSLAKNDLILDNFYSLIPEKYFRKKTAELPEIAESEIARHFTRLAHLNYSIEQDMYPLGSCTMKYNPKINEVTAALDGFAELHPNSTEEMAQGALAVIYELGECLKEITGLPGVSLQPAAGSHGEFAGILMFKKYHQLRGDTKRTKILIPDAAHGTNPASAAIAGFEIVSIKSNENGRVDVDDLRTKVGDDVAGFMLTNPNTVGIFERRIDEIEELIHGCGGLMYMDGANLNALLGIVQAGAMKFDCIHINLHKTFSTPHGGGGPGAGPVCVSEKLIPYLPTPVIVKEENKYKIVNDLSDSIGKLHTFFGNFGVLVRALTYIRMHGSEGLRKISEVAIINANYLLSKLKEHFIVPFSDKPMHEFTLSADNQKKLGVNARDIAKRLLDYGFHAPTIYFPLIVHECLLIEPTETETIETLDRYAEALINIAKEAETNPELVTSAPTTTPVARLNEALAARQLNISWYNK